MLVRMSGKQSELEGRLDDMLSRIAMETQEIKELEQQLTDGQILANEALQRDLEGIISGLQEYLRGLRQQADLAQQQVHSLQAENRSLQLHLEDTQRHCRWLEDTYRAHRQDMCVQQEELSALRLEAQALRDRQKESSRQQVELEAELQQLREGLQITLGQEEKSSLQQVVQRLHTRLDQTRTQLDQVTVSGPEELDEAKYSPEDMLSRSVKEPHTAIQQTKTSREKLQRQHDHGQGQGQAQDQAQDQDQAQGQDQAQDQGQGQGQDHGQAQDQAQGQGQDQAQDQAQDQGQGQGQDQAQAQDQAQDQGQGQDQAQDQDWRLKEELETLRLRLQTGQSRATQTQHQLEVELEQSRLQLQDVQQERDALLQQLRSQSDEHQRRLGRLNRKLRQLGGSMCSSDQRTAEQLKSTTEQLRALSCMVELLHTHRQQAPSLGSQGTQDSGFGLQYFSSPEGARQQDRLPTGGGHRVSTPRTHTDCDTAAEWRDSGGGSDADRSSRGRTPSPPPPAPAAGVSAGLSDCHTPPLGGAAWLLCGSPAAVIFSPPAGGAALHCNIPEHRDTVNRCVCECVHTDTLQEEKKKKLRLETKQLRHTLRRHRSVMQVCDEVECVEKTLLKRRAELRQADRLLLEAQSCITSTRDKVEQQEQRLVRRREEVREEEQRLQSRVQELLEQREALLSQTRCMASALRVDEQRLIAVQSGLDAHRAELKHILQELLVEQQTLEEVKAKRTQSVQRLNRKQEEVDRKQDEVDRKRQELAELRQEVEYHRKEAEFCLTVTKQQRTELQELQEEVSRRREERSSIQERCEHLEARRRSLLAEEEEEEEELSDAQRLRQEV